VSALEDRLGVQLMRRTTRSLTITDTGSSFYERSARILADLEEAESAVAQEHGDLRGRLRVALPLSFGVHHMGAPLAEFRKRHPAVDLDLDLSDRYVDLMQDGFDVAIRIGPQKDSSLIARRIFDSRLVVCASSDYIDANGEPASPDELIDHNCLVYTGTADPNPWAYEDSDGSQRRVRVRPAMSANSGDILMQAAADGLGVTLQPTFLAHSFIKEGRLLPLMTDVSWPIAIGYAVYPPTRHLSYRVREFISFLAGWFEGVPYWDLDCGGDNNPQQRPVA
jgi:DNA-binding transcriptional LysR family regulator